MSAGIINLWKKTVADENGAYKQKKNYSEKEPFRERLCLKYIYKQTYFKETYQVFILKTPNVSPNISSKVFTKMVSLISNTNLLKTVALFLEVVTRLFPAK